MGEERKKSDDGVSCKELLPGFSVEGSSSISRVAHYLFFGLYSTEEWARQVGERFLREKRRSAGPLLVTLEPALADIEDAVSCRS